ncbi:hypothetical protein QNH46_05835 [Paenibacillus woosongensis]|uniref:Uncharacterized protein n=1 Tax=Paenibacillus woosongensis TaxID=307580 RepID=A0AA95L1P0_9BACL|nr:hypothetical protein [Paenibacillus woosongensis]WHX50184.1 hypothetical protein QNH46_05835 [Paenibacillus woosongensis]
MELKEIMQLPDIMLKEKTEEYFIKYINYIEGKDKVSSLGVLESFSELADRHAYTYELLDDLLRKRVDNIVQTLWDPTSVELVDLYSSVVVNLNLKDCYELMRSSLTTRLNDDVRKIVEETIDEIGEEIELPYKMN